MALPYLSDELASDEDEDDTNIKKGGRAVELQQKNGVLIATGVNLVRIGPTTATTAVRIIYREVRGPWI